MRLLEEKIKGYFLRLLPLLEFASSKHTVFPMLSMLKLASVLEFASMLSVLELTMTITIAMTMAISVTICSVSVRAVRAMSYVVSSIGCCSTSNHTPDSSCVS